MKDIEGYLEVDVYAVSIAAGETGAVETKIEDIETRPCAESDYDNFNEFDSGTLITAIVQSQWGSFDCVNNVQDLSLAGAYGSSRIRWLFVDIKPCSGDGCKSAEEIEAFTKSVQIWLNLNNQHYLPEEYSNKALLNKMEIRTIEIGAQPNQAREFTIKQGKLNS